MSVGDHRIRRASSLPKSRWPQSGRCAPPSAGQEQPASRSEAPATALLHRRSRGVCSPVSLRAHAVILGEPAHVSRYVLSTPIAATKKPDGSLSAPPPHLNLNRDDEGNPTTTRSRHSTSAAGGAGIRTVGSGWPTRPSNPWDCSTSFFASTPRGRGRKGLPALRALCGSSVRRWANSPKAEVELRSEL